MSLASVEGLVVALLFVVPGVVGIGLRNHLWAKEASSFDQVLLSLAYSTSALLVLEVTTGALGLVPQLDWRLGSFLTNDLLAPDFIAAFRRDLGLWYRFLTYAAFAALLPSALKWLRTRGAVLILKSPGHRSLHNDGFEALLEETRFDAQQWDPRWSSDGDESPWLMIDTDDGRRFMGQMVWRSTAPHPVEFILIDVRDVTVPEGPSVIPGLLLQRGESVRRLWVMRPGEAPNAEDELGPR